jgi:N,N'-diacetyllegionaminate synthase
MEFTEAQWASCAHTRTSAGLAVHLLPVLPRGRRLLLARVGIDAWKIASGEVGNMPLLDAIAADGRPVLVSSGMSDLTEVAAAVELLPTGRCGRDGAAVHLGLPVPARRSSA